MHLFYIFKRSGEHFIPPFVPGAAVFTLAPSLPPFRPPVRHCGALFSPTVPHLRCIPPHDTVKNRALGALAWFLHFDSIFIKRNAGDDNDKNDSFRPRHTTMRCSPQKAGNVSIMTPGGTGYSTPTSMLFARRRAGRTAVSPRRHYV